VTVKSTVPPPDIVNVTGLPSVAVSKPLPLAVFAATSTDPAPSHHSVNVPVPSAGLVWLAGASLFRNELVRAPSISSPRSPTRGASVANAVHTPAEFL